MITKYFDFEKAWEEFKDGLPEDFGSYLDDHEVSFHNIIRQDAIRFITNPDISIDLETCELNIQDGLILFNFGGGDIHTGWYLYTIVVDSNDEIIRGISYEQG